MKAKELSAEALLGLFYEGLEKEWVAYDRGLFFRNYSEDVVSIDEDARTVTLSRDGWLRYLPQELVSPEDEIREKKEAAGNRNVDLAAIDEDIRKRISLLGEAFVPLDSFSLRTRITLEKKVQEILDAKRDWILKTFYDFDMASEQDEYVRQAALLLPYLPKIGGNVRFVQTLMETITGRKVRLRYTTYGATDHTRCATRKVFIDVIIDGLDSESYRAEMNKLHPLASFLKERFLPMELVCEIGIKGKNPDVLLLDYNYEL